MNLEDMLNEVSKLQKTQKETTQEVSKILKLSEQKVDMVVVRAGGGAVMSNYYSNDTEA